MCFWYFPVIDNVVYDAYFIIKIQAFFLNNQGLTVGFLLLWFSVSPLFVLSPLYLDLYVLGDDASIS